MVDETEDDPIWRDCLRRMSWPRSARYVRLNYRYHVRGTSAYCNDHESIRRVNHRNREMVYEDVKAECDEGS